MAIVPTMNGSIDAFASNLTQLILEISAYFAPWETPTSCASPFQCRGCRTRRRARICIAWPLIR